MHMGHGRFSLLNQAIFLIPLDSKHLTDGCTKASLPSSPPKGFLRGNPGMEQTAEVWVQPTVQVQSSAKAKNEYNSPDPKRGFISRGIFLPIVASKHTSVTKITHLLSQRTLISAAVARPRKEPKFFSFLGKN